jgi:3-phosphoshikimate 1-carboxyvinyltransferase
MTTGEAPAAMAGDGTGTDGTHDDALIVRPAARLRGSPALPGDKSISHRALLLALLAHGDSTIAGAGDGDDVRSTAGIVAALGATVERTAATAGRVDYRVVSPGGDALTEPEGVLDCGNSGTTTRLVAGVLAGRPLFAVLDGDASLRRRPMGRIAEPLTRMGALFAGRGGGTPRRGPTGTRPAG